MVSLQFLLYQFYTPLLPLFTCIKPNRDGQNSPNKYAESLSLNIQSDGYKLEATLKYDISSLYWRGFRMDLVAMGSFACWEN